MRSKTFPGKKKDVAADSFSAEFRMNYDGKIILEKADQSYLYLKGISGLSPGADIKNYFNQEEYSRIRRIMESYQGHPYKLNTIEHLGDNDSCLWRVAVYADHPHLTMTGERLKISDKNIYGFENLLTRKNEECADGLMIVKKSSNGFCCLTRSEELPGFLREVSSGKDFSGNTAFLNDVLLRLWDGEKPLTRCLVRSDGTYRFSLTPLICDKRCAAVHVSYSGSSSASVGGYDTENLYNCSLAGFAALKLYNGSEYFFYDINRFMAELINKDMISKASIAGCFPFRSAAANGISSLGIMDHLSSCGEKYFYFASVTPVFHGGVLDKLLVCVIPSDNNSMLDASRLSCLTPRECNVVRLTAEGFDSKYISRSLNISEGTVKRELSSSYRKLKVNTKTEALLKIYHLR